MLARVTEVAPPRHARPRSWAGASPGCTAPVPRTTVHRRPAGPRTASSRPCRCPTRSRTTASAGRSSTPRTGSRRSVRLARDRGALDADGAAVRAGRAPGSPTARCGAAGRAAPGCTATCGRATCCGRRAAAVLVDPAAHGGHRETDLAMLALFGLPHLDRVLAAYDEAWPLDDGWRDRVALHQLHPLLVHAAPVRWRLRPAGGVGGGRLRMSPLTPLQRLARAAPPARQWSSERCGRWRWRGGEQGRGRRARPGCGCSCSVPRSRWPRRLRRPARARRPAARDLRLLRRCCR